MENRVAKERVGAFGGFAIEGDVRAVENGVAEVGELGEGGVFDDGFGEGRAHFASQSVRMGTAYMPSPNDAVVSPS